METENKKPKSWTSKIKWYFLLLVILAGAAGYLYYWYQDTASLREQAQAEISKVEDYDAMMQKISDEYLRCQAFISEEEGDFGSFEYCKGYVTWYKAEF